MRSPTRTTTPATRIAISNRPVARDRKSRRNDSTAPRQRSGDSAERRLLFGAHDQRRSAETPLRQQVFENSMMKASFAARGRAWKFFGAALIVALAHAPASHAAIPPAERLLPADTLLV